MSVFIEAEVVENVYLILRASSQGAGCSAREHAGQNISRAADSDSYAREDPSSDSEAGVRVRPGEYSEITACRDGDLMDSRAVAARTPRHQAFPGFN